MFGMLPEFFAKIAARFASWQIRRKGLRVVVTRPWSGGEAVVWEGVFEAIEFERVHDGRGFVFFAKALPRTLDAQLVQWASPETRPRLIDYHSLRYDEGLKAWKSAET